MCNLYRMTKATAEIANLFGGIEVGSSNAGVEVYPGYPGIVVAPNGSGAREVRSMTWGFPLVLKGRDGQPLKPKPVNNARTDKLDGGFWRDSFAKRRCLIPVTDFAEAEGPKGAKTRTWLSLADQPLFAVAGVWRDTLAWGPTYSMVMCEACDQTADVHDRMPVILRPDDWDVWTGASPIEARALCVPYAGEVAINRTSDLWVRRA